jgi:hypothetical protein
VGSLHAIGAGASNFNSRAWLENRRGNPAIGVADRQIDVH